MLHDLANDDSYVALNWRMTKENGDKLEECHKPVLQKKPTEMN